MQFVNAKINIGLQIVSRRPDGYHDLQTLFYPVGLHAGTAENPECFCDMIEISPVPPPGAVSLRTEGRNVDCAPEKNLVYRAAAMYMERREVSFGADILLHKNLPDGAGMGGGSADAAFTLLEMDRLAAEAGYAPAPPEELASMALALGADCPFFLLNKPAYAEGVGERLREVPLSLDGCWITVVKPDLHISTREAFAGVTPRPSQFPLSNLHTVPMERWRGLVHNDFEDSLFPNHPVLKDVKEGLYTLGAVYASLTGSGSALYGIFGSHREALQARDRFNSVPTIEASYLLKA